MPTKNRRNAVPRTGQKAAEIQSFGTVVAMPIGLSEQTRRESVDNLNQVLADTMTLRDMYKKHHWQVAGPRSINSTSCSTSILASRASWWIRSPSGS